MANEAEQSLAGFAEAFGIVAGASLLVAAVAVVVARAQKLPIIPKWREPVTLWPGSVVLGLFVGYYVAMLWVVMPLLDQSGAFRWFCGPDFPPTAAPPTDSFGAVGGGLVHHAESTVRSGQWQLRIIWTGFFVVPLLVFSTIRVLGAVSDYRLRWTDLASELPGRIAYGIGAGLVLVVVSTAINLLTTWIALQTGSGLDRHPLTELTPAGDGYGGLVFALSVILVGPLAEELLFRGLVLNWAEGDWHHPWLVMVFAALYMLLGKGFVLDRGPMAFLAFLGLGLYAIQRFAPLLRPTFPTRTVAAVWSSSALFVAAHSGVWPTPIPLFVLALGLGYLTARTRDITAAVVVHGMFNAVSFVYLLRGGAG